MKEDRACVLGGFNPAGCLPCYVVQVISKHGREWIVAVECDEEQRRYRVRYLDAVPWESWAGDSGGKRPLIDGDDPRRFAFNRMQARRRMRCPRSE